MRFRDTVLILLFAGACGASSHASAQCAGFSDVGTNDQFCIDVTWLKNRQITLGCTATSYCPGSPVVRLSMAAFMNRLGNIVTPRAHSVEDSGGLLVLDPASQHILCVTLPIPAHTYDRKVRAKAVFSYEVSTLQGVGVSLMRSVNGGLWEIMDSATVMSTAGERSSVNVFGNDSLANSPTTTRRYALRVLRAFFSSGAIASWSCHLQAMELDLVGGA